MIVEKIWIEIKFSQPFANGRIYMYIIQKRKLNDHLFWVNLKKHMILEQIRTITFQMKKISCFFSQVLS